MKYLIIPLILILAGCSEHPQTKKINILDYQCDADVLDAVDKQYNTCNKTSFPTQQCYSMAVISHCKLRETTINPIGNPSFNNNFEQ